MKPLLLILLLSSVAVGQDSVKSSPTVKVRIHGDTIYIDSTGSVPRELNDYTLPYSTHGWTDSLVAHVCPRWTEWDSLLTRVAKLEKRLDSLQQRTPTMSQRQVDRATERYMRKKERENLYEEQLQGIFSEAMNCPQCEYKWTVRTGGRMFISIKRYCPLHQQMLDEVEKP